MIEPEDDGCSDTDCGHEVVLLKGAEAKWYMLAYRLGKSSDRRFEVSRLEKIKVRLERELSS